MKFKYLTLVPLLALTACGESTTKVLNIVAPKGAPTVALYNYCGKENFTTGDAGAIRSMMTKSSEYSVVVLDTYNGVQNIQSGAPYKLAASITFGNFYLAATGNDDDGTLNVGDRIYNFNRGGTSDQLFHYIYGNEHDENIIWGAAASDAKTALETGVDNANNKVDYVFIAQPALFAALKNNSNASVYHNIQTLYQEKTNNHRPIQASVFIKNNLDKEVANAFLSEIETSINAGLDNPDLIFNGLRSISDDDKVVIQHTSVAPQIAKAVTLNGNGMGIGFENALSIKDEIDDFLNILGLEDTNEEIYYK